jgi:hypothetical protein
MYVEVGDRVRVLPSWEKHVGTEKYNKMLSDGNEATVIAEEALSGGFRDLKVQFPHDAAWMSDKFVEKL